MQANYSAQVVPALADTAAEAAEAAAGVPDAGAGEEALASV